MRRREIEDYLLWAAVLLGVILAIRLLLGCAPAMRTANVPQNVAALRAALQHGPVYAVLMMMSDFPLYTSGVYEWRKGWPVGCHAVALVGYQDAPGQYGGGWFVARNSSGPAWGEAGHVRIGYSQVSNQVALGQSAYRYWGMVRTGVVETWYLPWVRRYADVYVEVGE